MRTASLDHLEAACWIARVWRMRSPTRPSLQALEVRLLDDVGLTRDAPRIECAKWFWRPKGKVEMQAAQGQTVFFGWRIVGSVFVLAMFGWAVGFYGPPVYLHAVREARGWSLALVSTGITGWALAQQPWQLFLATLLSGGGRVTMGAAAVNAIISPWFVRTRPAALASAYNGSSVGGVIFSPLWVAAIGLVGFGCSDCPRTPDGGNDLGAGRSLFLEDARADGSCRGRRCAGIDDALSDIADGQNTPRQAAMA